MKKLNLSLGDVPHAGKGFQARRAPCASSLYKFNLHCDTFSAQNCLCTDTEGQAWGETV